MSRKPWEVAPWTINEDGSATLHIPMVGGGFRDVVVGEYRLTMITKDFKLKGATLVDVCSDDLGKMAVGLVKAELARLWMAEWRREHAAQRATGGKLAQAAQALGMTTKDLLDGLRSALDAGAFDKGQSWAKGRPVDLLDWARRCLTAVGFELAPGSETPFFRQWLGRVPAGDPAGHPDYAAIVVIAEPMACVGDWEGGAR